MRFHEERAVIGSEIQYYFESNRKRLNASGNLEDNTISDYTLVNLFAGYEVTRDFRVDARLENIFDVKYANYLNEAVGVGDFPAARLQRQDFSHLALRRLNQAIALR